MGGCCVPSVRVSVDEDPEDRRDEGPVGVCLEIAGTRVRRRGCLRSLTERKFWSSVFSDRDFPPRLPSPCAAPSY